jgi:phenylacetate-coenzyme A ligase PaaK-like adenylate-forming protein
MNSFFNYNCIYKPIQLIRGEQIWKIIPSIKETETYSYAQLNNFHNALLGQLLQLASKFDFYNDRLQRSNYNVYQPFDYQRFIDISPLTKDDIRNFYNNSNKINLRYSIRSTSGTSGEPLVFPKDRFSTTYGEALMYQVYGWYGINPGDRQGRIWGSATSFKKRLFEKLKDRLLNRRRLSSFYMNKRNYLRYWKTLKEFQPKYIYCYPNAIYEFTKFLSSLNYNGKILNLNAIICTGELLFDYQRQLLSDFFGCPIVNEYGSTENGIIAFECPYNKMHLMSQNIFLEVVDSNNVPVAIGEEGNFLITELHSHYIPFIRYFLGDRGRYSASKCDCGIPYPTIEITSGRIDSFIIKSSGEKIYDAILAYTFKNDFKKFSAIQKEYDKIEIFYTPQDHCNENTIHNLEKTLRRYLGSEFVIIFKRADDLNYELSGKYRYFTSKLNQ